MTVELSSDIGRDVVPFPLGGLVIRSQVPAAAAYKDYRGDLSYDFYFSCAYCQMHEAEAVGIRFTIDHYEPQSARPDLLCEYSNLMYCCDECNIRKGDLVPPVLARDAGIRFFRPDTDFYDDHFEFSGIRVNHKSEIGRFTISYIDLNRHSLLRIRECRERMEVVQEKVIAEIAFLQAVKIDRFPRHYRSKVFSSVKRALELEEEVVGDINDTLRRLAYSPLMDDDSEAGARAKLRAEEMAKLKTTYPEPWRGRQVRRGLS